MPSRIHWSQLKTGLAAVIVIVIAVVSILLFARVGALHGETERLFVTTDDTEGVLPGTDVWLAGKKIGLVKAVRFRPVTTDTLQRIAIETEIVARWMPLIRRNSYADIRPGGNLIGSRVVYIRSGTSAAAPVTGGDTILSRKSGRTAAVGTQIDTLVARVSAVAESSGNLLDQMKNATTTIGAFRTRGMREIRTAGGVASSLTTKTTRGSGTSGLSYRGEFGPRVRRLMAQKDSITLLLSSGRGNLGRFRRDSTLAAQVARVRAEVDSLRMLMLSPSSGVARLRTDIRLKSEIARMRVELDSLMADMKKNPLRYISF
jgi:phospholipid/cholesterol/gamma-HCH transport system substrate-binding protein